MRLNPGYHIKHFLLYFETIENFTSNQKSNEEIIKAACLADLYGMTDYSIEILNYYNLF